MKQIHSKIAFSLTCACLLALAGCGGGGGGGAGSSGNAAAASSTLVSGVASKGPLNAATVCAYAITDGLKGASIGRCVSTDAVGNYNLDLGNYTGPVTLEVTGGSYTDEATGNTVLLATPLHSAVSQVAPVSGGTRVAVTALTELAYQQATTTTGGLSMTNIRSASATVEGRFGVSDIVGTMPVDALNVPVAATDAQKVYALALSLVSQFQKDRSSVDLSAALTALQSCIASPENGCGSGSTAIGTALSTALATFQSNHPAFAAVALPVANFDVVPSIAPITTTNAAKIDASWGMRFSNHWLWRPSPSVDSYQLCYGYSPNGSDPCEAIGNEVFAISSSFASVTQGRADGINLAGLTRAQAKVQVNCVTVGLEAVQSAFLSKPKPTGVTFDELLFLNSAAVNATSPEDFAKRYAASLVKAGVTAAADAVIPACDSAGTGTAAAYFKKTAIGNNWTMTTTGTNISGTSTSRVTGYSGGVLATSGTSTLTVSGTTNTGSGSATTWLDASGALLSTSPALPVTHTVLPANLSVGTTWVSLPAYTVGGVNFGAVSSTIAAFNVTRTVPAGTFTDCLKVTSTSTLPGASGVTVTQESYMSASAGTTVEVITTAVVSGVTSTQTDKLTSYSVNP